MEWRREKIERKKGKFVRWTGYWRGEEDRLYATSKSFFQSKMKNLSISIWWLRGNILCYDVSIDSTDLSQWLVQRWSSVVWAIDSMDVSQCVSVFVDPLNTRVMRIFYFFCVCVCVRASFILVSFSFKKYERECFRYQAFLSFFLSVFFCYRQYTRPLRISRIFRPLFAYCIQEKSISIGRDPYRYRIESR